ncbi:hypothetical protein R3O64_02995 [Corynebacterium hesseae]|uniref:hypothetical protein n=1 Tax=Corynebacterium hesseae TaxID=2913502 RepID=UPI0030CCBDFB
MATRSQMSRRYRDMTSSVNQLKDTAQKQLRATNLGNAIAASAAALNHRDQKTTHRLLEESIEAQREQTRKIVGELRTIDKSINAFARKNEEQLEDLKHINFAQWRDGVGREYYYNYRPQAKKYLENFENLSNAWLRVVSARMVDVVQEFPQWKEQHWRSDALKTGVFIDPPGVEEPPVDKELPRQRIPEGVAGFAMIVGPSVVILILAAILMPVIIGIGGAVSQVSIEGDVQSRFDALVEEYPEFVENQENLIPEFYDAAEAQMLLDEGCTAETMQEDLDRASSKGVELDLAAFPQDSAGVERYCSTRTSVLEIARDRESQSDQAVDKVTGFTMTVLGLALVVAFILPFVIAFLRRNMRQKRREVEQQNQAAIEAWEQRAEQRKVEFQQRNDQAREEAFKKFQRVLGVPINKNLGTLWADTSTRNMVQTLSSIIENELRRPPVVEELPEIGGLELRLNPQIPSVLGKALISSK